MNNKIIASLLILIIAAGVLLLMFVVIPELEQEQMLDYNNEYIPGKHGFKTYLKCPIDNSTINQTVLGYVKEYKFDPNVVGRRINIIFLARCEEHNLTYSQG